MANPGVVALEKTKDEALSLLTCSADEAEREEFHHYLHSAVESGTEIEAIDRVFEWLKVAPAPHGEPGVFAKLIEKVPEGERKVLIAQVVYMLFLGTFKEEMFQGDENVEFAIVQLIAVHCSKATTATILSEYTKEEQTRLVCHILINYDEGSYILKHMIEDPTLKKIIHGFDHYYFDRSLFFELQEANTGGEEILARLEEKFEAEMDTMYTAVHPLIPALDRKTLLAFFKLRGCTGMLANEFTMPDGGVAELLTRLHTDREGLDEVQQQFGLHLLDQMVRFANHDFTKIVYMLPTVRSLEDSQYLRSVIEAYDEMGLTPTIVIYDQCEGEQLAKNKEFAAKLGLRHFDREETLKLADEQGVRELVDCNDGQTFGYAGARNACFFLTGAVVEGEGVQAMAMGDDDMEMSVGSLFYDMVSEPLPLDDDGEQLKRCGHYYGRQTTYILPPPSFETLKSQGKKLVQKFVADTDEDRDDEIAALSGSVFPMLDIDKAKAKMKKPTPTPGEENDVIFDSIDRRWAPPMFHMSGSRLPKTDRVPAHPWSGMEGLLWSKMLHYWGAWVKDCSDEDPSAGGASRVIISKVKSREFDYEIERVIVGESIKQIEEHLVDKPEDGESLKPILAMYTQMQKEICFAMGFAAAIANHPDRIEELVVHHNITRETHPAAWALYMTDRAPAPRGK